MPSRRWTIIACLFLVLATLTVYGGLRYHHFINLDDPLYVTDNPPVQGGLTLAGLVWAFTTRHAGFWIPLTWLSFMVDSQLFGLNPGGFFLTNLLLHLANTLLLFFWLRRTTRALGPSFLVAALFALHPLHVESVAWATERKDVLSTFFWLLTMWAYLWYAESQGFRRYGLILVCFSLGLMAKPMLVTLPLVLLLLDYWPLGRWPQKSPAPAKKSRSKKSRSQKSGSQKSEPGVPLGRLIWEKIPLLALAAIFSVVTIYAQKEEGALAPLAYIPFSGRLPNVLVAYVIYLVKMIYPSGLAVFYPYSREAFPLWQWLGAGLTLSLISLLIIRKTLGHRYLLVGWLWYLVTLVPVIGLVQVGEQARADRFTYVPLIGLFIMVAYGMAELAERWRTPRLLLPVGGGMVLTALMICTWVQVGYWRDPISLFEHSLKVTGGDPIILNDLGNALAAQGNTDQAFTQYEEALRLDPDYALTHYNLGIALAAQGKLDQAIAHYAEALRLKPDYAVAHNNLGVALRKQGKLDQAEAQYAEALRLKPDYAEAYDNLAIALVQQGKIDEAIPMFNKAIQIKPDYSEAYSNLGLAFAKQGNFDEAIINCQNALKFDANDPNAQKILSILNAQKGTELIH